MSKGKKTSPSGLKFILVLLIISLVGLNYFTPNFIQNTFKLSDFAVNGFYARESVNTTVSDSPYVFNYQDFSSGNYYVLISGANWIESIHIVIENVDTNANIIDTLVQLYNGGDRLEMTFIDNTRYYLLVSFMLNEESSNFRISVTFEDPFESEDAQILLYSGSIRAFTSEPFPFEVVPIIIIIFALTISLLYSILLIFPYLLRTIFFKLSKKQYKNSVKYLVIGLIIFSIHIFVFNSSSSITDSSIYDNFSLNDFEADQVIPLTFNNTSYKINSNFKSGEQILTFSVDDNSDVAISGWWFKVQIKTTSDELLYSTFATIDLSGSNGNQFSNNLLKLNIEQAGNYILNIDIISRPSNFNDFNAEINLYNADSVNSYIKNISNIANAIIKGIHFITTIIFVFMSLLAVFFQIVTYDPDMGQESGTKSDQAYPPIGSRIRAKSKKPNFQSNSSSSLDQKVVCSTCGTYNERKDRICKSCGSNI